MVAGGLLIVSVVLNAVSAAVYPHYPPEFDNPVFDLAFPLLGGGYVPYSARPAALERDLVAGAARAARCCWRCRCRSAARTGSRARWAAHAALAVAIAAVCLVPLSRYGRAPSPAEARAAAFVRSTWEPPPRR